MFTPSAGAKDHNIRVANLSAMEDFIMTAVVQSCEMFLKLSARSWFGLVKCGPISYSYELQKIL